MESDFPDEARAAINAATNLATASFADASLSEFRDVYNQCIEVVESVRALTVAQLNSFHSGRQLILSQEQFLEFKALFERLHNILPLKADCPECGETGRLALKAPRAGTHSFQVVHERGLYHSAKKLKLPDGDGLVIS